MVNSFYKGVSPLVASVLLISFTMAIAAILATWATQYMTQQTSTLTAKGQEANCVYARMDLDTYTYDKTNGQLVMIVNNRGRMALQNFTLFVFNTSGIGRISLETDGSVINRQNATLPPGEPRSFIVNNIVNITRFRVVSNCPEYSFVDQGV
jgi:archaellum component FlaF (FlaF/FlaG flagellin family)